MDDTRRIKEGDKGFRAQQWQLDDAREGEESASRQIRLVRAGVKCGDASVSSNSKMSISRALLLASVRVFGLAPIRMGSEPSRCGRWPLLVGYNVAAAAFVLANAYLSERDTRNDAEYSNMSLLIGIAYDAVDVFGNLYVSYSLAWSAFNVATPISAWFRLRAVDCCLSRCASFDYGRMQWYACFNILLLLLFAVVFTATEVIGCARVNIHYTINFWVTALFPLYFVIYVSLLFGCVALALYQRYWVVNAFLEETAEALRSGTASIFSEGFGVGRGWSDGKVQPKEQFHPRRKAPPYAMLKEWKCTCCKADSFARKIRTVKEIHFELFQLMNDFNASFGFHFLFQFVFCFFGCTINLYFVIIFHLRPYELEQYVSSCVWSVILLSLASYIVFHSNLVSNEIFARMGLAHRTTDLIHMFLTKVNFADVQAQNELKSLSIQIMQCPVQFKAGGFFDVNSSLLFQFLTGVLSSVVFVVQFDKINFAR